MFDRPGAGQLVSGGLDWSHPSRAGYYGRYGALIAEVLPLEDCLREDPIEVIIQSGSLRTFRNIDSARNWGLELDFRHELDRWSKGLRGLYVSSNLSLIRSRVRIAEEDLRLRGEGEVLGTRQSGLPGFKLARLDCDRDLLEAARDDARLVIERDPELVSTRGEALRVLLYLFERDAAVRLLRAG